jgi:hypothetical protein
MQEFETNWTRQELKAYILIYCANADFNESKEETDLITEKIPQADFDHIHDEFDKDNDYQSIQKIQAALKKYDYTKDELEVLLGRIKELFLADGNYDVLEQNLYRGLHRILE